MIGTLLLASAGGTPAVPGGVPFRSYVYNPPLTFITVPVM
jgi:hypothetical protein